MARRTVRGQAGLVFTYGPNLRCVRWRESAALAVAVCDHGAAPLPPADLLKIAESMRRAR